MNPDRSNEQPMSACTAKVVRNDRLDPLGDCISQERVQPLESIDSGAATTISLDDNGGD